jgi:protein involved in temperature-dependent protein secretion
MEFLSKSPKKLKNPTPILHTCLVGTREAVLGSLFEHKQMNAEWARNEQISGMEAPPFPTDHTVLSRGCQKAIHVQEDGKGE